MRRLLVLLLMLAGCQPLPHPFADLKDAGGPALRPPDSAGVVVAPIAGAPAGADALAAALRDSDVPASTVGGNRSSYRLDAQATVAPLVPGRESVTLDWTLRSAKGAVIGQGTEQRDEDPAAKDGPWPALAKTVAPKIADLIAGNAPAEANDVPAAVTVRDVAGAPGDGGTSLARAIGVALGRAGVAVGGDARFALSCQVAVAPAKGGQQLVTVHWVLARPEGGQVGEVSQQNAVPAGSLDGAWGDIAYAVAGAAAPGIAQLVARAEH
jgi:hypothetical protein